MCGLVFSINSSVYTRNLDDWFRDALIASQVRGLDSTGIFVLNSTGKPSLTKGALPASLFVKQQAVDRLIDTIGSSRIAIGHVRAATVGNVVAANAHPFRVDREDGTYVIGAHNGTLRTWKAKEGADKFDVDSEWVFNMIADKGKDAFRYFSGAFALVWYDSAHPKSLFMARNSERPLHYMVTENGRSIIGCSELGMLGWLSHKHEFKCHEDRPTPYYLEAGMLYEFSLENIGAWKSEKFPDYDYTTSFSEKDYDTGWTYDDRDPWDDWSNYRYGMMGYPSSTVPQLPSPTATTRDEYDDQLDAWHLEDQENTLNAVKEALRTARYTLQRDSRVVDTDDDDDSTVEITDGEDLERALHAAIANLDSARVEVIEGAANPKDPFLAGDVSLHTIEPSTPTMAEQQAAMTLGCFGKVVRFKGEWFDEDTSECWGIFETAEGKDIVSYEGVIRMVTGKYSEDTFIRPRLGQLAVIAGVDSQVTFFVLEKLTKEQLTFVEDMVLEQNYQTMLEEAMH